MGDYIYMQGTAQIKPSDIKVLQKFFNSRHEGADYELNWADLEAARPDLRTFSAFYVLKHGRSQGIPFSMPNPTGWPDSFDDLPEDPGSPFGLGECELSDEGLLKFKCSDRNRKNVIEAFISLLPVFSINWLVHVDYREWFMAPPEDRAAGIKVYVQGSATMDEALDTCCDNHQDMLKEELQGEAKRIVGDFTPEDLRKIAESLGLSPDIFDTPAETVHHYTQLMQRPKFAFNPEFESALREKLIAAFGLTQKYTEANDPDVKLFSRSKPYVPDARTQPLTSSIGRYDSVLDHITHLKLFARGKKGVRQVKRKQRRAMKA